MKSPTNEKNVHCVFTILGFRNFDTKLVVNLIPSFKKSISRPKFPLKSINVRRFFQETVHRLLEKFFFFFQGSEFPQNDDGTFNLPLEHYRPHDQWMLKTPVSCYLSELELDGVLYNEFVLKLQIERRPRFHVILSILPSVLLYILSPLVFLLPVESGEKTSTALTVLLSQVVSMGTVSVVLPESSNNFPILNYFIALSIVQMGLNTILSVLG